MQAFRLSLAVLVCSLVSAAAFAAWGASPAKADGGPHIQGHAMTTDACAGCHRAHTAGGPYLLKTDELSLCLTCHDGTGATTDVLDGVQLVAPAPEGSQVPLANVGLKAGGFNNALIDTEDPSLGAGATIGVLAAPEPVTSTHSVDGSLHTAWGNGALNSGPGLSGFMLECTSCHDPHGNGRYRILRPIPTGSGAATGVDVPDTAVKTYWTDDYFQEGRPNIASWCSQCHTRYLAPLDSAVTDSTDAIFAYRHATNDVSFAPTCVKCHTPHGTNATMTGFADTVARPGEGTDGVGGPDAGGSRLLKMDNRGLCQKCHNR